jgi:hypothetical protein
MAFLRLLLGLLLPAPEPERIDRWTRFRVESRGTL